MSDDKKDLTRIEDLGEFLHELNSEEDFTPSEDDFSTSLPDLPVAEEGSSFESTDSGIDFGSSSDETPAFESTSFESSDFGEETSPTFGADEGAFDTSSPFTESTSSETSWNTEFTQEEEPQFNTESEEEPTPLFPETEPESAKAETTETSFTPQAEESFPSIEEEPTPLPVAEEYTPSPQYTAPETFEDLKKFSESSSFTGMATEGNPSFSILVKNIRYLEDVNDIVSLLKEFKLLADSEEQTKDRLMRGNLLIPRISEYAAIFMAHKLRRFDVDLQIGLSDEIHPPKHQETPELGIVSRHSLYQNQNHHFHFDDPKLEISQIIVAATPSLEGYQVIRYMGVASEHKFLDSMIVEDENSSDIPLHYQELAQKLKAHALKNNSNAVVGLNYQLTPIPSEFGIGGHKYRLTCTGNLVWVNKL